MLGGDNMFIKEVEKKTGISANTLRYYEAEGLIHPKRNPDNQYREYSSKDVEVLLKIKFLRNLDMSVKVIAQLINCEIDTETAINVTLQQLKLQKETLELNINLLEILKSENELSTQPYTHQVFDFYKAHPVIEFCDKISGFISRHFPYLRMGFFPEEAINSKEDFILELIHYAKREDKKLQILEDSMMPRFILNDVTMQAVLVPVNYGLNYRIVKFQVLKSS